MQQKFPKSQANPGLYPTEKPASANAKELKKARAKISPHQGLVPLNDRGFEQEIKALECALEYDCNVHIIHSLMQLYTTAIETYECQKNPAFSVYQGKMKTLLKRPDVLNTIKACNKSVSPELISRSRASTDTSIRQRAELSTERITEKAIQWHKSENGLASERIQENLKKQIETLNLKISSRKKQAEQNAKILAFEKGVEEIMEEYIQNKEKVRSEVNEKYREQLDELSSMAENELFLKVLKETKKKIEEEIVEKLHAVDIEKRKKIQNLKNVINLSV